MFPAGPPAGSPAALAPCASEPKLFIGQVPLEATQADLFQLFSRYGTVKTCVVIQGPDGRSKGCAKVLFERWSEAEAACDEQNGSTSLGGTKPMVVKFADPPKRGGPDGSSGGIAPKKLFVGQVRRSAPGCAIRAFSAFSAPGLWWWRGAASSMGRAAPGWPPIERLPLAALCD
jgi:CUG-BP- and ETR3-like factor